MSYLQWFIIIDEIKSYFILFELGFSVLNSSLYLKSKCLYLTINKYLENS